ncbi:MAG TPA: transcription-repair coupling factor, partial [Firmicutes bacterium]|nr:transcription-repair coupling factor [Bacillota bacterium]
IQTYVTPYKEEVVDELISRELSRKGQVFYVHNKVESIYACASKLSSRIPSAKVGVVHGQMDKNDVEDVMSRFYDNDINVLVCTSIVENGIDIPNANMIIVENADTFGLSQLYQIKGRVGRGNRISYAYLMYKPYKNMNEDAKKRLQAIQEFTELGSGYKIAQRDLMIRGAGDILGPEQAGFIDSIGLDLYMKMLNEAIEAKKIGKVLTPPPSKKLFDIDAYIPSNYASKSDKIVLYQELESIDKESDLIKFSKKIRDVYGKLPKETSLLIQKKRIDILSDNEEFTSIEERQNKVDISLSSSFSRIDGIGSDLFNGLLPLMNKLRVTYLNKTLVVSLCKQNDWLNDLETIMKTIHSIYLKFKKTSL